MEIDIRQLLKTALRLWWVPVITVLVLGLVGVGIGSTMSKSYMATTQMLVPPEQNEESVISDGSPILTYQSLITSGTVLDLVILDLGLDMSREDLASKITVALLPGTQIIEVSVSDSDPELAANITNSLATSFETEVVDLTTGEFERNLDNLQAESDGLQSQITVLDTRINEIDTAGNADDSETQVEIDQLERERLKLSQNKSDIDATIRALTSQISMAGPPIVVMDIAEVPENAESSSTILLGLFGAFIGALLGLAILVMQSFRDPKLREEFQVVSQPVLAKSSAAGLTEAEIAVLAARLHSSQGDDPGALVVVSPRSSDVPASLAASLAFAIHEAGTTFVGADNLIESATAVTAASKSAGAVIYAEVNTSTLEDLEETEEILRSIHVPILGTVLKK